MAKHPFADQARELLMANGIVFNEDGSTSKVSTEQSSTTEEPKSEEVSNTVENNTGSSAADERDTLLEMQRAELEKLRKERDSWQQTQNNTQPSAREQELERELEDLKSKISEQTTQEQLDEFRSLLESEGFETDHVDEDVLLELRDRLIKPVAGKLSAIEQRLSQFEAQHKQPTAEDLAKEKREKTYGEILKQLPDFNTIFESEAFQERLGQKDPRFPTATFGKAMQIAYEEGDASFIVQEMKAFLNGGKPQSIADVADVGATNGVGGSAPSSAAKDNYTYSAEEAVQMLRKRQMGDLTMQQYSEYRAKFDEHQTKVNKQ